MCAKPKNQVQERCQSFVVSIVSIVSIVSKELAKFKGNESRGRLSISWQKLELELLELVKLLVVELSTVKVTASWRFPLVLGRSRSTGWPQAVKVATHLLPS